MYIATPSYVFQTCSFTKRPKTTQPALNLVVYKDLRRHRCFLRTYSARIYFIVSNSSLACLHMPHPTSPVDDIRVRPSYRALGPVLWTGREDVWLAHFAVCSQSRRKLASGLDVSLMDYLLRKFCWMLVSVNVVVFCTVDICCNVIAVRLFCSNFT